MRLPAHAFAFLVCIVGLAAGVGVAQVDAEAEPSATRAEVSRRIGTLPLYCATLGEREICTWHQERARHVVCDFDTSGRRTPRPCATRDDNEQMRSYPDAGRLRKGRKSEDPGKQELHDAALARVQALASLDQVVALVGAGPAWCDASGEPTCAWHAVRRTPGYIVLSRAADAPGKKLTLRCRVDPRSGSAAGCRAGSGLEGPPNY